MLNVRSFEIHVQLVIYKKKIVEKQFTADKLAVAIRRERLRVVWGVWMSYSIVISIVSVFSRELLGKNRKPASKDDCSRFPRPRPRLRPSRPTCPCFGSVAVSRVGWEGHVFRGCACFIFIGICFQQMLLFLLLLPFALLFLLLLLVCFVFVALGV